MSETFVCKSCGKSFEAKAIMNKKHGVVEPMPCPNCQSICTRPDSFLPSFSNWVYEEMWDEKIRSQRKSVVKSNPKESVAIFYKFVLRDKWLGLNKKDCTVDIELWDSEMRKKVQENYGIMHFEKILFYRDTSLTGSGKEGLVLTSHGIHYRPSSSDFIYNSWQSIISEAILDGDSILLDDGDEKTYTSIPMGYFVKGYGDLSDDKKVKQNKFICELIDEMIMSKSIEDVDFDQIVNNALCKKPKNYAEPPKSIISYFNVDELHVPCEDSDLIKELEGTLNSFEVLESSIYTKLGELDEKYDEWKDNVNRQAVHAAYKGYKANNPGEMVFAAAIALVGNVYGEIKKEQNKARVDMIMSAYEKVKQQYLVDYFCYIAFQISKLQNDLMERRQLVINILNKKIINLQSADLSILNKEKEERHAQLAIATAEKCFHIYCKAIVRQQDLVNILLEMIDEEGEFQKLDFREVIAYEIFRLFAKDSNEVLDIPVSTAIYKKHI